MRTAPYLYCVFIGHCLKNYGTYVSFMRDNQRFGCLMFYQMLLECCFSKWEEVFTDHGRR